MKLKRNVIILLFGAALFGCSSKSSVNVPLNKENSNVIINKALFSSTAEIISEKKLFQLTDAQEKKFLAFSQQELLKGIKAHKVIEKYLSQKLSGFTYYGKTYISTQAMELNKGNCMSLALLTASFASLLDVEIDFRMVHSVPVFEKHGNVLLSSSHVQSILYDPDFVPDEDLFYFSRPSIAIDYFPQGDNIRAKRIDFDAFTSMYYVNKASEQYIEKNFDMAFKYVEKAYQLNKNSSPAINILALLHKNKGDFETAEAFYELALAKKQQNINVLDNYLTLLEQQGKVEKVASLKRRMKNIYDPNPYNWLEKAQIARSEKRYTEAANLYQKVIRMTPYVKQAYVELRDVYLEQGKRKLAVKTLERSLIWIHDPIKKKKFKKQLYQLTTAL